MAINDPGPAGAVGGAVGGGFMGAVGAAVAAAQSGISQASLEQAKHAAQGLVNSAKSGQVQITDNGFKILNSALDQCETHLQDVIHSVDVVSQAPMLGTSPYAQTVATHVQKGGTGETESADAVIKQFQTVLDMTRDAINQAKKAYEENEHRA